MPTHDPLNALLSQGRDTLLPRAQARQMPGLAYTSRELFQQEKHRIFRRTWLCLGREEEVPHPGDYVTLDIMGDPIVVSRDKAGGPGLSEYVPSPRRPGGGGQR